MDDVNLYSNGEAGSEIRPSKRSVLIDSFADVGRVKSERTVIELTIAIR